MNSVYNLLPINKSAALVTNQKGCEDEITAEQERQSILDHIKQIEAKISTLRKSDQERKELGVRKLKLQQRITILNKKMRKVGIGPHNRNDFTDCVFQVLKDRLSNDEYRRIIRLAEDLYRETKLELENKNAT